MKSLRPEVTFRESLVVDTELDPETQIPDVITDSAKLEDTEADVEADLEAASSRPDVNRMGQSEDVADVTGQVLLNDIADDISILD